MRGGRVPVAGRTSTASVSGSVSLRADLEIPTSSCFLSPATDKGHRDWQGRRCGSAGRQSGDCCWWPGHCYEPPFPPGRLQEACASPTGSGAALAFAVTFVTGRVQPSSQCSQGWRPTARRIPPAPDLQTDGLDGTETGKSWQSQPQDRVGWEAGTGTRP